MKGRGALLVTALMLVAFSFGISGCGSMDDQDRMEAIRLVQEYKTGRTAPSVAENIQKNLLPQKTIHEVKAQKWTAEKSSQGLYRVVFQFAKDNAPQELVFGADLRKGEVQALNRDALEVAIP